MDGRVILQANAWHRKTIDQHSHYAPETGITDAAGAPTNGLRRASSGEVTRNAHQGTALQTLQVPHFSSSAKTFLASEANAAFGLKVKARSKALLLSSFAFCRYWDIPKK